MVRGTQHAEEEFEDFDGDSPSAYEETRTSVCTPSERASVLLSKRASALEEQHELKPLPPLSKAVTTGKLLFAARTYRLPEGADGVCAAVNPAGDTIAVALRDSRVLLLDAKLLRLMNTLSLTESGDGGAITALVYRPDTATAQNVLLVAHNDAVVMLHASSGRVLNRRQEEGNQINCIALRDGAGAPLATAGRDGAVRVYDDAGSGALAATLRHGDGLATAGHSNAVFALAWVPDDPNLLVSAGWDQSAKVWDLRSQRAVRSIPGPYVCGDALAVTRSGRLLTGSWRNNLPVQLWDLRSGELLTNAPFHQAEHEACMVYAAKVGTGRLDGLMFAGGSGKRPCVRVYQVTGELAGTLPLESAAVGLTQLSAVSRTLLVCCSDRLLQLEL